MTHNNYIYIAVMALVSYAFRILPIVQATQSPVAGAVALVIGIAAAWCGASLFQVAVACCAVVFVLEFFL